MNIMQEFYVGVGGGESSDELLIIFIKFIILFRNAKYFKALYIKDHEKESRAFSKSMDLKERTGIFSFSV